MSFLSENMLGILIATIILLIYVKMKKMYNYFEERGIPYIKPTWKDIYNGLTPTIFIDYPKTIYERMSKERPYIGMFHTFIAPVILIMDPSLADRIMIRDFSYFHDHGVELDPKVNPMALNLFNLKGDEWRALRLKLLPTFTTGKLKGMLPFIDECAEKLVKEMKSDSKYREEILLKELYHRYTFNVIVSSIFGIDPESVRDPECQFQKFLTRFMNSTVLDKVKVFIFFSLPWLANLLRIKIFPKEVDEFFLTITKQTIDMRKKSGEKRSDFLQLLLELKEKGHVQVDAKDLEEDETEKMRGIQSESLAANVEITDELLAAQFFVFFIAGFDNVALFCTLASYCLSKHPEIQQRVREEVREMKRRHGGMNYFALREMKLLSACIDESVRLYFPAFHPRVCTKDYTFGDGVKITKGTPVLVPVNAFNGDSKYWPNPKEFNPDAFLNKENIGPGVFTPFGDGPRICIGQRLALTMIRLALAKLIDNFEFVASPKTKESPKLLMQFNSDFDGGAWCTFKPL